MNKYRKLDGAWVIACDAQHAPGEVVPVGLRDGTTKNVMLAEGVAVIGIAPDCQYCYRPMPEAAPAKLAVGGLAGVLALFKKAREHLKFPAIVLSVPGMPGDGVRITVAGAGAKFPGTLNVASASIRDDDTRYGREWYGRIDLDGHFAPTRKTSADAVAAITSRLRAFAAEPAKIAGEHGRLTGRCCFCNQSLSDERSTAVGYGRTCAGHFGMPWGSRPEEFAAKPEPAIA